MKTVLTYKQARAQLTSTFTHDKVSWLAYKQGKSKSFETEEAALAFSPLVERITKPVQIVSRDNQHHKICELMIESVLSVYDIRRHQFDALAKCVDDLLIEHNYSTNEECFTMFVKSVEAILVAIRDHKIMA